jgi:hypothetical protein
MSEIDEEWNIQICCSDSSTRNIIVQKPYLWFLPFAHLTGVFLSYKVEQYNICKKVVGPDVICGLWVLCSMRGSGHVALNPPISANISIRRACLFFSCDSLVE